jgi:hypothetical protein
MIHRWVCVVDCSHCVNFDDLWSLVDLNWEQIWFKLHLALNEVQICIINIDNKIIHDVIWIDSNSYRRHGVIVYDSPRRIAIPFSCDKSVARSEVSWTVNVNDIVRYLEYSTLCQWEIIRVVVDASERGMIIELLISKVPNQWFCDAGICYQAHRRDNTVWVRYDHWIRE